MGILGRAMGIVGDACRQATNVMNRCGSECVECGRPFCDGDTVKLVADGVWKNGRVTNVGGVFRHDPPCRPLAKTSSKPPWAPRLCVCEHPEGEHVHSGRHERGNKGVTNWFGECTEQGCSCPRWRLA